MSVTILVLLFAASVIYTAAGQAGASGYIAIMALYGVAPEVMKPTALTLNVLVSGFGTWRLHRAGLVEVDALWPYLAGSLPMAFLGGAMPLSGVGYRLLVGAVLLYAGIRLWRDRPLSPGSASPAPPPRWGQITAGGAIGLLSGLTGLGGGIFLGPLVLLLRWADPRRTAGLTTPFILVNSVAALAGNALSLASLPGELPAYAAVTMAGAALGTHLAITWFSPAMLQRAMAVVLILGGANVLLLR